MPGVPPPTDFLELDYTYGPPRVGDQQRIVQCDDYRDWTPTVNWESGLKELIK